MTREEELKEIEKLANSFAARMKKDLLFCPDVKGLPKLTSLQILCFVYVSMNKDTPLKDIATNLGISKQQASKLIDSLVAINYIDRQTNPNNRREVVINMSSYGAKCLAILDKKRHEEMKRHSENLTDEELGQFYEHIKGIGALLTKWRSN